MIKNIVFDIGNVLVAYDGCKVCKHYIKDKKDRKRVFTAIFQSPEWVYLEHYGRSSRKNETLTQMCARLPKRLHEAARLCMRDWHLYNMKPIKAMIPVIQDHKRVVSTVYLLQCLPASADVLSGTAAGSWQRHLFSAEKKLLKPQKKSIGVYLKKNSTLNRKVLLHC